jgi:ABC-type multidrug transport system fused ATPase/permease subunit
VKLTNELLQGISAIKSYSWEAPFAIQLQKLREDELQCLQKAANLRAILVSTLNTAPSFVAVCSLSLYALLGNQLTPTKVFTSLALFNQLRFPLIFFPLLINALMEGKISLNRLTKYLLADEIQDYVTHDDDSHSKYAIQLQNSSFSWSDEINNSVSVIDGGSSSSSSSNRDRLVINDLSIGHGELVAIIGPTGTGKSTLLNAMLGELNRLHGTVTVNGDVAYVPQSAWIPNDSLRNVVLFGNEYNESTYMEVLEVCGLKRDVSLLDNGDMTEIGERGVNLSGGQKQRLSIARAVYQDADIYLLDDPLSALDASVGSKLFQDCIQRYLSNKTRVLVTHQLNVLSQVDRIIIMNHDVTIDGFSVLDQGSLLDLISRGHDLSKYVQQQQQSQPPDVMTSNYNDDPLLSIIDNSISSNHTISSPSSSSSLLPQSSSVPDRVSEEESIHALSTEASDDVILTAPIDRDSTSSLSSSSSSLSSSPSLQASILSSPTSSSSSSKGTTSRLMTKEERAEGSVGMHIYSSYLQAANKPLLMLCMLAAFILSNASQILQQWVVAAWTSDVGYVKRPLGVYLASISFMATCVGAFTYLRTYLQVYIGAAASRTIHRRMIGQILGAPLSYFGM